MDMYKMWCGNHCSNSEYMGGIKYDGCIWFNQTGEDKTIFSSETEIKLSRPSFPYNPTRGRKGAPLRWRGWLSLYDKINSGNCRKIWPWCIYVLSYANPLPYLVDSETEEFIWRNAEFICPLRDVFQSQIPTERPFVFRCIFRSKVDTDSGPKRTVIPEQNGHRFRSKVDSDSAPKRTLFSWFPECVSTLVRNWSNKYSDAG